MSAKPVEALESVQADLEYARSVVAGELTPWDRDAVRVACFNGGLLAL